MLMKNKPLLNLLMIYTYWLKGVRLHITEIFFRKYYHKQSLFCGIYRCTQLLENQNFKINSHKSLTLAISSGDSEPCMSCLFAKINSDAPDSRCKNMITPQLNITQSANNRIGSKPLYFLQQDHLFVHNHSEEKKHRNTQTICMVQYKN